MVGANSQATTTTNNESDSGVKPLSYKYRSMILKNISRWTSVLLAIFMVSIIGSTLVTISPRIIDELFQESSFARALLFSLQTSLSATVLAAISGVPTGFFLARNNTLATTIIDTIFDIPIVIPPVVTGIILLSFFNLPLLKHIHYFIFTTSGAVIAQFIITVPYTIRASKTAFALVPRRYEQIAMTLGAGPVKAFFDTTLSLALPAIFAGLILSWLRCIGEFGATLMVGGGIQGKTENLPIYIYLKMSCGDFDKGMAAAIVTVCFAFCGIFVMRFYSSLKDIDT